jgi:hypothetical protein
MRTATFLLAICTCIGLHGAHLRVHGTVTDLDSRMPLEQALVRVYKDGVKQASFVTGTGGRYAVMLENNAHYVIRFSLPGRVTKCFAVDTHGPAWENDGRTMDLEVEMTLFENLPELDLSFFDLPMGIARFTPMTGHVAWNAEYEGRIRPEADRLLAEVVHLREQQRVLAMRAAQTTASLP